MYWVSLVFELDGGYSAARWRFAVKGEETDDACTDLQHGAADYVRVFRNDWGRQFV